MSIVAKLECNGCGREFGTDENDDAAESLRKDARLMGWGYDYCKVPARDYCPNCVKEREEKQ